MLYLSVYYLFGHLHNKDAPGPFVFGKLNIMHGRTYAFHVQRSMEIMGVMGLL